MTNPFRLTINLQVQCAILKRVVYLLDGLFWMLTGGGLYFLGAKNESSILLFLAAAGCFIGSYEIGYKVQHLIIRLELNKGGQL